MRKKQNRQNIKTKITTVTTKWNNFNASLSDAQGTHTKLDLYFIHMKIWHLTNVKPHIKIVQAIRLTSYTQTAWGKEYFSCTISYNVQWIIYMSIYDDANISNSFVNHIKNANNSLRGSWNQPELSTIYNNQDLSSSRNIEKVTWEKLLEKRPPTKGSCILSFGILQQKAEHKH